MGLEILGGDPIEIALDCLTSRSETLRREVMRVRTRLYRDDYKGIIRDHKNQVFLEPAVADRLEPFIDFIGGSSFLKRVSDEQARPLYARSPIRRVIGPNDLKISGLG